MRSLLFTALTLMLLLSVATPAQTSLPEDFLKGYARSLKGGGFQYHSPDPEVGSSLLVRSIDSVQYIEWETEAVPADYAGDTVRFIWMFGIDANPDSHRFRLSLNGKYLLHFSNPVTSGKDPWRINGPGGSSLVFKPVLLDKYSDPMGYAVLSVPAEMAEKGRVQRIRIAGESKESRSWYMTFETGVEERVTVLQEPALLRTPGGPAIPLVFRFIRTSEAISGTLAVPGTEDVPVRLDPGCTEVRIPVPAGTPPGAYRAILRLNGEPPSEIPFTISPFRHFTIYLVQHTHTDIGYTRPQTEILPDHLRYIDYALDFCDQTDSLPDDARFRWTCETSWAVREYLRTRPKEQSDRLKRRVAEGRIEPTALFLNGSDLADETMTAVTLQVVKEMRDSGLAVNTAMQSDINGVPWCLADYLPKAGVRFLNMAQNTHRADKPFERPTTFWWESPSGTRLMVNRPEHYMYGNTLGILTGTETFARNLFRHLANLEEKGYPYDRYAIQFSGYLTDNSPPSTTACKLVEEWNRVYEWPRLRLATLGEFAGFMARNHAEDLPVIRGAWPDWWMDGFGSAAIQTAYGRAAHSDYIANEGLAAMATLQGAPLPAATTALREQVADDIAFYDEHTFGAAESITDPGCENSVVQLAQKEAYVWSAVKKNRLLREQLMGLLRPHLPQTGLPAVTVFNTLGHRRSGPAAVYIDHQLLPADREFILTDEGGAEVGLQEISTREEGTWWMAGVQDIPPLGYRTYTIHTTEKSRGRAEGHRFSGRLENNFYRIVIDTVSGKIASIFDKEWNRELVDAASPYTIGEFIYERLGKNRGQMEQKQFDEFTRVSWSGITFGPVTGGPLWESVTLAGSVPECASEPGILCEIRLFRNEKRVEFRWSMRKKAVTDPEAVYIAFPFHLEGGRQVFQVAGGTIRPWREQVEGSATDWTGIQDFAALRNREGQIVLCSPEIPLVQPGAINTGKFYRTPNPGRHAGPTEGWPATGAIFSWVLNNYWTTNFLASQEGEMKWSYAITSGPDTANAFAAKFGAEVRIPMPFRVSPGTAGHQETLIPRAFLPQLPAGIQLVSVRPAGDRRILLQLRETNGCSDSLTVYDLLSSSVTLADITGAGEVTETNVLLEPTGPAWSRNGSRPAALQAVRLRFKPFEVKFILITPAKP